MEFQVEKGSAAFDDLIIMPTDLNANALPTPPATEEPLATDQSSASDHPSEDKWLTIILVGCGSSLAGSIAVSIFLLKKRSVLTDLIDPFRFILNRFG